MEGSEAMAEAAIAAGCRFFAGYPMTPFTELLEHFAKRLPEVGGVCVNAESELEAVGMCWGALTTGARAATGSTGQGLSLMQESFAEAALARLAHGDLQHVAWPERLLPSHAWRRARRLPPHRARADGRGRGGRAHATRVPSRRQVAQPGARLRRLPHRAHLCRGRRPTDRRSTRSLRRTGGSTARPAEPVGRR